MKSNRAKQKHTVRRFIPYLKPFRKEIIFALLCGIIGGATAVLMTYYIGKAVDQMAGAGTVDFQALFQLLWLILGILAITTLSQWIIQILGNHVSYQAVASLKQNTFDHLNHLPLSYFDQTSHGNILSRFTNDMDFISEAGVALFNNLFSGMTIVILSLISMIRLSPTLTLVVLVTTPLMFLVMWSVAHSSQRFFSQQQKIVGTMTGYLSEMIGNQKVIKMFEQERNVENHYERLNAQLYTIGQKAQFASSLTNPLSRFIDHLAYLSIGLVGGLLLLSGNSEVTVGIVSSFTIYSSQFSKPFIDLSGLSTQIQTALAGLERTFNILDVPCESPSPKNELKNITGNIQFENVYFSYTPEQNLISDFNLDVAAGKTVAIVGQTGAGKSTLVNLLMRFYDVTSGQIKIDGKNIQDFSRKSLRRAFGMVLQDTWLFEGSIWDNLVFGNENATVEEVTAACKSAWIHEFIIRLPEGYQTIIGEGGVKISDGQRQLLTIARTMIQNPPMLILDEATSSVDTLTEQNIQRAFLLMMQGKTSFVIAHRLSTIREADQILVMDQGNVVESGTHEELLNNPHSHYSKLYQAQFQA